MVTAKHKFQKLIFNPANHKLVGFLDELHNFAKEAFGIAAQAIIEQFIYCEVPPHLKKSINQTHLENCTYEQFVTYLEKKLELNGLEAPGEQQIKTVSHNTANTDADRPIPTRHHCKKQRHYRIHCLLLKKKNKKNSPKLLTKILEAKTVAPKSLFPTTTIITTKTIKTVKTVID